MNMLNLKFIPWLNDKNNNNSNIYVLKDVRLGVLHSRTTNIS